MTKRSLRDVSNSERVRRWEIKVLAVGGGEEGRWMFRFRCMEKRISRPPLERGKLDGGFRRSRVGGEAYENETLMGIVGWEAAVVTMAMVWDDGFETGQHTFTTYGDDYQKVVVVYGDIARYLVRYSF